MFPRFVKNFPEWCLCALIPLFSSCALADSIALAPYPVLQNPLLDEISGLSNSRTNPQIWWAHNDSGDLPRLFRVGSNGEDLGSVSIKGITAADWEDSAALEFDGKPAVLIADIGDNRAQRQFVQLFVVADMPDMERDLPVYWRQKFIYEDGARDAEGIAVDPLNGDWLVLSKREAQPALYLVPKKENETTVAKKLATLTHIPAVTAGDLADDWIFGRFRNMPTGMDISSDGLSLLILTYKDAYIWTRTAQQSWAEVLTTSPQLFDLPQLLQTEAAAFSADGKQICVSSERPPSPFVCLPRP